MALCNLDDLHEQACESGFVGLHPSTSKVLEIALLQEIAGSNYTLDDLFEQACASGFVGHSPKNFDTLYLQELCNLS